MARTDGGEMLTRRQFIINSLIGGVAITLPIKLSYNCDEIFRNDVFNNENLWFLHDTFLKRLYSGISVPFSTGNWAYYAEHDLTLKIKDNYTIFDINKYFKLIQNRINEKYDALECQKKCKGESVYFFKDEDAGYLYPLTIRVFNKSEAGSRAI